MRKVTIPKDKQYKTSKTYWEPIKVVYEFSNLQEFDQYLNDTPTNTAFATAKGVGLSSQRKYLNRDHDQDGSVLPHDWHGTDTYETARQLMTGGWSYGATALTKQLKDVKTVPATVRKLYLDQVGYQAIVPLYLQGVPNNMVNQRRVVHKQKVVDLVQVVSFSAGVSVEKALDEATKGLQIVELLERNGFRTNVSVLLSTGKVAARIQLKHASEPLHIAKLAYPMCHPAMFRRQYFRFVEVAPEITKAYVVGYGTVPPFEGIAAARKPNEIAIGGTLLESLNGTVGAREIEDVLATLQQG